MQLASGLSLALSTSNRCLRISRAHVGVRKTAVDVAAGLEERRDRRTIRIEGEGFGRRLELHAASSSAKRGVRIAPAAAPAPCLPSAGAGAAASAPPSLRSAALTLASAASLASRRTAVGAHPHA